MFKVTSIFGSGGNGSMPTLGGGTTSLASALAAVDRAEQALEAARALARAAARREGKSVRNLFGEGKFVSRASAERWTDQARSEGGKAMAELITRGFNMDESPPFQHLAKRLKQIRPEDWPEHVAKMRAVINYADHPELFQQSKGEAILAAGRRARMSADAAGEVPEPKGLAKKIIEAGKKARRPTGSDE